MNADKIVKIRQLHEDYIRFEGAIHGGTGTAITNCYSYQDGHDEFVEWIIDGFSSLLDYIESLQEQLAESQRRERAAVSDLENAGACFSCKHFKRNGGSCSGAGKCRVTGIEIFPCNEPGVYRIEVPDDGRDTYDWRGPVAGEERG